MRYGRCKPRSGGINLFFAVFNIIDFSDYHSGPLRPIGQSRSGQCTNLSLIHLLNLFTSSLNDEIIELLGAMYGEIV